MRVKLRAGSLSGGILSLPDFAGLRCDALANACNSFLHPSEHRAQDCQSAKWADARLWTRSCRCGTQLRMHHSCQSLSIFHPFATIHWRIETKSSPVRRLCRLAVLTASILGKQPSRCLAPDCKVYIKKRAVRSLLFPNYFPTLRPSATDTDVQNPPCVAPHRGWSRSFGKTPQPVFLSSA